MYVFLFGFTLVSDLSNFIKPVIKVSNISKRSEMPNSSKGDKLSYHAGPRGEIHLEFYPGERDSSGESSILDVNNDEIFDDSVFTSYDEKNISTITQKMSKHWRKKFKEEDRKRDRNLKDKLSIEQLVQQQIEKDKMKQRSIGKSANLDDKDKHVTDNRRRRTKPGHDANNQSLDLHYSEIGKK